MRSLAAGLAILALLFAGCAQGATGEQGSGSLAGDESQAGRDESGASPDAGDPAPAPSVSEPAAGGTSSATPESSEPAQQATEVLTERDTGELVEIRTGESVPLRLSSTWVWDAPRLDGTAVELTPVNYFTDPGFQEWIVSAVVAGEAVVSATGTASDGRTASVEITFAVR